MKTTQNRNRLRIAITVSFTMILGELASDFAFSQDNTTPTNNASLVMKNPPNQPRYTPATRDAMKQYLEDLKQRTPRIPLPQQSEDEKKLELEDPRTYGYEGRLRRIYLMDTTTGSYSGFSGSSGARSSATSLPPDPALTLDYAFKVRLFWIAARANNCQYCLGHQESKLLAAGMSEDAIAALDSDWGAFDVKEQVAFALAKRLTNEPHLLTSADIDACKEHFSDLQILEMIGSIAGNNAINRWKEGTGVPQSTNGGNFGRSKPADSNSSEEHSYLTPTSKKFVERVSTVAVLDTENLSLRTNSPTACNRPPLEMGEELAKRLAQVDARKPRLPLASDAVTRDVLGTSLKGSQPMQWHRLLANFPVAGKRFVDGIEFTRSHDELSIPLQAMLDWVVARQDRAWYAIRLADEDIEKANVSKSTVQALDGDLRQSSAHLAERDRLLLIVAKNLAASPIVLTDAQVDDAIRVAGPRAVTQVINYTTFRAAFDRITEAAGLGK
jgi:hypothetical protein